MFDNAQKTIEEGQKRWDKIEAALKKLREGNMSLEERVDIQADVIILLVDHLRPMNPSQEDLDEALGGLRDLIGAFGKK